MVCMGVDTKCNEDKYTTKSRDESYDYQLSKMAYMKILFVFIAVEIAFINCLQTTFVTKDESGKFHVSTGVLPSNWVAQAQHENKVNETG